MRRVLHALYAAAGVPWIRLVYGVVGAGMCGAGAAEYCLGFGFSIRLPNVLDVKHGQHHAFGIAQCNLATSRGKLLGKLISYVKRDRDRPQKATCQSHVVADAFVIGTRHKAAQRRKTTTQQQLQVTDLPSAQVPRWPILGLSFEFSRLMGLRVQ